MFHVSNYRLKFDMWINIKEDFFFQQRHEAWTQNGTRWTKSPIASKQATLSKFQLLQSHWKWSMTKAYIWGLKITMQVEFVLYLFFWNHTLESITIIYLTFLLYAAKKQRTGSFSVHLAFSLAHLFSSGSW